MESPHNLQDQCGTPNGDEQRSDVPALLAAPCPVLILDAQGMVMHANETATSLYGEQRDGLAGIDFLHLLDGASRDKGATLVHDVVRGKHVADYELNHRTADGSIALLSYAAWRLPAADAGVGTPTIVMMGRPESATLTVTAGLATANRRLETLLNVAKGAAGSLSIERAVSGALDALAQDRLIEWAIVLAPDEKTDALQHVQTSTHHRWEASEAERLFALPMVQEALQCGRPMQAPGGDVLADILGDPFERIRPLLALPVVLLEGQPGALVLAPRDLRGFTDEATEMLTIVALQLALTLENARLYTAVSTLATTDPLTGTANRRAFEGNMARELERACRLKYGVGLLILDVDRFKGVNDTYGHACGDAVLKRVVETITTQCRSIDCVARLGGEEFVVLMSGTDCAGVAQLGERIRRAIAATSIDYGDGVLRVTASLGGAVFPDDAMSGDELLDVADRMLYVSKRDGRDRVTVNDASVAPSW